MLAQSNRTQLNQEAAVPYAMCGALLLLFRRVSLQALLLWALLIMPLPYLHLAIVSTTATVEPIAQVLEEAEQADQQTMQQVENLDEVTDSDFGWNRYAEERAVRAYSDGDLAEVLTFNIQF